MGGEYVSLCALLKALGMYGTDAYKKVSWVEKRGFPVHSKQVNTKRFKVVYIDEFWAWAEQHRSFLDFSRIPKGILGVEPAWVKDQRRKDKEAVALQRKDRWTPEEDELLRELLENGCGWLEASERMHRSCGAIQRRLISQGLMLRPDRKGSHETKWTNADREIMAEGVRTGESYMMIGKRMNRSEKAVRGFAYRTYYTEDEDRIRAMMGSGKWGEGAPSPTVRTGMRFADQRKEIRSAVSRLCGVLEARRDRLTKEDA